jgi:cytochrome c-type biogenesis protein CcmH
VSWIVVLALGLAAMLAGAALLRHAPAYRTLFAATLVFGLAGYAWQGSPGVSSSPRAAPESATGASPELIDARREFFDPSRPPSRFVLTGDTYARRGEFETASGFYRNAVAENPGDGEAWLALGVALVEYTEGRGTPAAVLAYTRARDALPGNPAPGFFAGLPELRAGNLAETRRLWAAALEEASETAEGRDYLAERLATLDRLIEVMSDRAAPRP